jgi:hypothetical protein
VGETGGDIRFSPERFNVSVIIDWG